MADPVRDFACDDNGEWVVTNGDFATVAGAAAVPQGIRIRLRMFEGECYLNEDAGVPYHDQILVKNPDPLVVRAVLSEAIAATPDVENVIGAELQLDGETRSASIDYQCDTVYSETPLNEQIGAP